MSSEALRFYLPVCFGTTLVTSLLMLRKEVPRWAGAILVALYAIFFAGGFVI